MKPETVNWLRRELQRGKLLRAALGRGLGQSARGTVRGLGARGDKRRLSRRLLPCTNCSLIADSR